MKNDKKKMPELNINVPVQFQSPVFSNIAQVHATDREVILDFAFLQPNTNQGVIVAKIALTPEHAKALVDAFSGVLKTRYDKKEKESKNK